MRRSGLGARVLLLAIAVGVGAILFAGEVSAQQKTPTTVEGSNFNTSALLADNIKAFVGKDVFVHLRSGKTLQGYVKSVGSALLHMEKLAGRDFYDALVRIEDISAIEAKFRDMK